MNHYFRVIRAGLILKVSKDVARLNASDDKSDIRVLASDIAVACKLLNYIDNGVPFWSDEV